MSEVELVKRHIEWLKGLGGRDTVKPAIAIEGLLKRAEAAEAKVAALTKALEQIANFEPDERAWSVLIARKALEEASR